MAVHQLDWCLDTVVGWMRVNKLKLNSGNTEALRMGHSCIWELGNVPVLDGVALPPPRVYSLEVLSYLSLSNGLGGKECLLPA